MKLSVKFDTGKFHNGGNLEWRPWRLFRMIDILHKSGKFDTGKFHNYRNENLEVWTPN